jgi:hypothetical protein
MNQFPALSKAVSIVAVLLFAAAVFAAGASAAEWGSLKGRFILDGPPPARAPLNAGNEQFCVGQKPLDETIVVGENGALVNLAIYISLARGANIEAHPDYAELATKPVELNNKNCHFEPHVTLLRSGQPFIIKNSDPVAHNTNVANNFNEVIGVGEQVTKTLTRAAALPIPVACNAHPFMKGHLLVLDHPYMAVTDEKGAFEIKNIPAGVHGFTVWHESPGYLRDLRLGPARTDRRGKVDLTIKPNETLDLGDIHVTAAALR